MNTSAIHNTASHTFSAINNRNSSNSPKHVLKYDKINSLINLSSGHLKPLSIETYLKAATAVKYHLKSNDVLHLHISLIKYNATSIRGLLHLFNNLNNEHKLGKNISVSWITPWGNQEVYDLAHDFNELYDFNIDIIPG